MEPILIVPAAGRGSRLQSDIPKVLYPIAGRAMIDHLLDLYDGIAGEVVLVLSPEFDAAVRRHCAARKNVSYAIQPRPDGMLPAILAAAPLIAGRRPRSVWITWCDQVAIHPATIQRLIDVMNSDPPPDLAFPTVRKEDPYIHFDRDAQGRITAVRHRREGDRMPSIGEGDSGLFALALLAYLELLAGFAAKPAHGAQTGERNFLPFIPWLAQRGAVVTFPVENELESLGVNTAADARTIEQHLAARR